MLQSTRKDELTFQITNIHKIVQYSSLRKALTPFESTFHAKRLLFSSEISLFELPTLFSSEESLEILGQSPTQT